MKLSPLLCVVACLLLALSQGKVYSPDDKNIQYIGRVDFTNPTQPVFSWPGQQILVNFQGSSTLQVTMKNLGDGDGTEYWEVIVDGGAPTVVGFRKGKTETLTVASHLSLDSAHSVVLWRRSEYYDGTIAFLSLVLENSGELLAPSPLQPKNIEFFGDSITVGLGCDASGTQTDNQYTDNYMAYGAQTARNLQYNYHCQAISGIGLVGGWGQLDSYWNLTNPTKFNSLWNFSSWQPDVLVQNLGQNDKWEATPSRNAAVQGYVDYVLMYRSVYGPDLPIVLALGDMDASSKGSPWPGYIDSAITELQEQYNDYKVSKCIFPYDNIGSHPHTQQHTKMANQLTQHILDILSES